MAVRFLVVVVLAVAGFELELDAGPSSQLLVDLTEPLSLNQLEVSISSSAC